MPAPPSFTEHVVQIGECIASIAARVGQTVDDLWDLEENAELRKLRKDPYVLLAGDRVAVPKPRTGTHVLATGQRHVFRRRATHIDFGVTVTLGGQPRANLGFKLFLDGDTESPIEGTSDGNGKVSARIPAIAMRGVIEFEDGRGRMSFRLGGLDPLDTISGVQGRLRDLGFYPFAVDGLYGPYTARALRLFQRARGLAITGRADASTKAALEASYGR